jgi:hypothetical protein
LESTVPGRPIPHVWSLTLNRPTSSRSGHRRLASVDALRGFTMFWIIGGDGAAKALAEMLCRVGMMGGTAADVIVGSLSM